MALICPIVQGIPPIPRRSYITTGTFHTDIFKYTSALNSSYVSIGTLTTLQALGTGNATNCPGNRILRENGRTLAPDANPVSFLVSGASPGSSAALTLQTVLVGVYDANSGLSGFIDPNSPKFQLYNGSKPNFQPDGVNPVGGAKDNLGANIIVSTISTSDIATSNGATTTVYLDATVGKIFKISLGRSANGAGSTGTDNGITAISALTGSGGTSTVPTAGSTVVLIITPTFATGIKNIKFTAGFRDEGTAIIPTAGVGNYIFTFISDGTSLFEISRNVGLVTPTATGLEVADSS